MVYWKFAIVRIEYRNREYQNRWCNKRRKCILDVQGPPAGHGWRDPLCPRLWAAARAGPETVAAAMKTPLPKTPADANRGLLLVLCASVGVAMTGLGIIWPLVPIYAAKMGARGLELGLIIASFNVGRTLAGPLAGRLSDRWGRKSFIGTGLMLYALLSVLYVQAADVPSLVTVRLLHGLAAVMVAPVAMALVADTAAPENLGRSMGTLSMAMMIGLGLGPVLGGLIESAFGMAAAFATMGALALATFSAVAVLLPASGRTACQSPQRPVSPAPVATLLRQRPILGLVILRCFTAAGQGCVYTFLPLLAVELQVSSAQIGLVLGGNIFLIAFLQRFCGGLADRWNPVGLLIGGTLVSGLAVMAMPVSKGFAGLLAANAIMGIGTGTAFAGGVVLAGRVGRSMGQGAVMGVTDSAWSLGMIAAPVMAGLIMDHWGMAAIFTTGGVLIAAGTGLTALAMRSGGWVFSGSGGP
jgi:DHA1 family multidrug resistance protein-like MFS transporter